MAITMQGSWTLRVATRKAAFGQRFIVSGADSGNGVYDGTVGRAVFVTGPQWSLSIQHRMAGRPWRDSVQQLGLPAVSGGLLRFEVASNAGGLDLEFDDLVIGCSLPVSRSDYVVYGNVKTYSGMCLFNPCRDDYIVIDPPFNLQSVCDRYPQLHEVLRKLYPERLRGARSPAGDAAFASTPLVIPTGLPPVAVGLVFESRLAHAPEVDLGDHAPEVDAAADDAAETGGMAAALLDAHEADAVDALRARVRRVPFKALPLKAGVGRLSRDELETIADIRDAAIRFRCHVERAPGLLLRFQQYHRTAAERLDGPYTGSGERENLGLAVTDAQGNYLFRFSRSPDDVPAELADGGPDQALPTALRPDLIVQLLGTGLETSFETAPYDHVANLRRIDLCVPHAQAHPSRACAGERVIQRVGDVLVLHSAIDGSPNVLDADGRITCRNPHAPQVDVAGWRGALRLYACFGVDIAKHYAVFHKRPDESRWQAVNEPHVLDHIPSLVPGGTPVGPSYRMVVPGVPLVGGGGPRQAPVAVPTYTSHEGDLNWIENDLKLVLDSRLYRPWDEPGTVQFRIEAYDADGHVITATVDTLHLYLHNRADAPAGQPAKGDIAALHMGAQELGGCGLFALSSPNAPLSVKYRAVDPDGFLHSWGLSVTRGMHSPVNTFVAEGVTPRTHAASSRPADFSGTRDEPTAGAGDYVVTTLQPGASSATPASWLPPEHRFCAFAFTLTAADRVTDGRTAYPQSVYWQDLVGLSYSAA